MPQLLSFVCAELNQPYEAVYTELAQFLEIDIESAVKRFAPDDAVARVRYHRRQLSRRGVQQQLADLLGIDSAPVFAAVSDEGARILLDALQAKKTLTLTTRVADEPELLSELEDAMAR
jgi:uncharacterized protein (DUF2342 family)